MALYGTRPLLKTSSDFKEVPDREEKPPASAHGAVWWWRFRRTLETAKAHGPLYFTRKGDRIYAIQWGWPGARLTIPNVHAKPGSTMRMLGVAPPLVWAQEGEHLVVQMPEIPPGQHAFSIAIQTE